MNAQAVPLVEHEDVKRVFDFYLQSGMGRDKLDAETLLTHMSLMESRFEQVFDELQNVRSQLQALQDKGIRATVTKMVDAVDRTVIEAKTQFKDIRDGVVTAFSDAAKAVKEKGTSALKKTIDFFKVYPALSRIKAKMDQAVTSLRQSVLRIEGVKMELHEAKSRVGNAGRLLLNKEAKQAAAYDSERGILAGIQKLMQKTGGLLAGISRGADATMRKIEELGQWNEKSSVRQGLREIRNRQAGGKTYAPKRLQERAR